MRKIAVRRPLARPFRADLGSCASRRLPITGDFARYGLVVQLGRGGGIARKAKLSPERRSELARKAALARWARVKREAEEEESSGEETSEEAD